MTRPAAPRGSFGARLRHLREQAGLTQRDLARRAGLAAQAVGHIEAGERKPFFETVQVLARALGVSVAEFDQPVKE